MRQWSVPTLLSNDSFHQRHTLTFRPKIDLRIPASLCAVVLFGVLKRLNPMHLYGKSGSNCYASVFLLNAPTQMPVNEI